MPIFTITAVPYDLYEKPLLAFRTADRDLYKTTERELHRRFRNDYIFSTDAAELIDCPECGLPLSEHGTTTEIDTLESCVEIDNIGDL